MSKTTLSDNQEHGSFSSGIVVGFLTGAVTYFLTKTQEGQDLCERFADHWDSLREHLIQEGKLSSKEAEITDYIKAIRLKISEFVGESLSKTNPKKRVSKKKTKSKRKIFKGI